MSKRFAALRFAALAIAALSVFSISAPTVAHAVSASCLPGGIKAKLATIRKKFGPVSIVSANRPGARIAGSGKSSYHASCRAVDFHPPRGKYRQVLAYLRANHSGGLGTYSCGMHHIHIDNGPRVRFHKCVNSVGAKLRGKKSRPKLARAYYKSGKKKAAGKKRYSKKRYAKKKRYSSKKRIAKKRYSSNKRTASKAKRTKRYSKRATTKRYTQKFFPAASASLVASR